MNKKAVGLRPLVMSIAMVVLFSLFIFSFVSQTIETQNPDSEVFNSKYGLNESKTRMNSAIDNFTATGESVRIQMAESQPTAVDYIFLIFKGAFYIPYAFLAFVFTGMTEITSVLFISLTGTGLGTIGILTINVLFASIIIAIVLLIVKAVRTGESER